MPAPQRTIDAGRPTAAQRMLAETHLNDLQADIEAGSRQLDDIFDTAAMLRAALVSDQGARRGLIGSLVRQIRSLRQRLREQRAIARQLRHDIRGARSAGTRVERRR